MPLNWFKHSDDGWVEKCKLYLDNQLSTPARFQKAIKVWTEKPNVINRRLCGIRVVSKLISIEECIRIACVHDTEVDNAEIEIRKKCLEYQIEKALSGISAPGPGTALSDKLEGDQCLLSDYELYVRDLIPKHPERFCLIRDIVVIDTKNYCAAYLPLFALEDDENKLYSSPTYPYRVIYRKDADGSWISIQTPPTETLRLESQESACWLQKHLLPRLVKWTQDSNQSVINHSLRLVSVDEYTSIYQRLKQKYGKELVKVWPETTDPMKFVYEDVAIAAYLLLIWKKERSIKGIQEKQSFIDLGCGNGLLVYILSNEGHQGLGLDVRRRKIWDMYGPETVLRESSIVPSDDCLFPEYDWIIGNHSDELTPWIPVIAARSSYKCCCFLLPCCAHDFDCKFVRRNSKMSQYRDYLSYVKEIGEICGFDMEEDIMRIPSTKRVCFVGQVRNYCETEQAAVSQRISDFISSRSKGRATSCRSTETSTVNLSDSKVSNISGGCSENECGSASSQVGQWAEEFKARSSVEAVRNCTKLNREVIVSIVNVISQELLRRGTDTIQLEDGRMWNQGGSIPISDVATLFDKTTLKQLKNECGGLQTLLRNHNNVFTVRESNVRFSRGLSVSTTEPTRRKKKQKCCGSICDLPLLYKTKLCWFHIGHPDGCPLSSAQCRFAHGQEELMLRPEFDKKQ